MHYLVRKQQFSIRIRNCTASVFAVYFLLMTSLLCIMCVRIMTSSVCALFYRSSDGAARQKYKADSHWTCSSVHVFCVLFVDGIGSGFFVAC